jgi:hypothetical protein
VDHIQNQLYNPDFVTKLTDVPARLASPDVVVPGRKESGAPAIANKFRESGHLRVHCHRRFNIDLEFGRRRLQLGFNFILDLHIFALVDQSGLRSGWSLVLAV